MDNFFTRRGLFRRETDDKPTPGIPSSTQDTGPQPKAGDYSAHAIHPGGRSSLIVPAWYRGVSLIMQTMGQMVVQYQRKNRVGGNFVEDRYGSMRTLNYLLQVSPNPLMTGSQMLEQIEYHKIFFGNAYVYIDTDPLTADIAGFYLATSGSYIPSTDQYQLNIQRPGRLDTIIVPSDRVLHFRNVFTTENHLLGLPTLAFAMKTLSIAATADEQTLKDMAKGGKYKLLVQENKPAQGVGLTALGRAQKSELEKATQQLSQDWMNHDAATLTNVADVKIISQTATELRTLENRGFEVSDIARILGVPTIMLMHDSGSNYKTPEAATQEFLLRTIQPRIREMEDELNRKLLGPDDFGFRRIHVCEQNLRRLDPQQQANLDKLHLETGAMCVNEIRQQYDLPEVPDGDIFYVSTNLAVIGSDKLKAPSNGTVAPSTKDKAGSTSSTTTTGNEEEEEKKGGTR